MEGEEEDEGGEKEEEKEKEKEELLGTTSKSVRGQYRYLNGLVYSYRHIRTFKWSCT
jgi:hypothetical protein